MIISHTYEFFFLHTNKIKYVKSYSSAVFMPIVVPFIKLKYSTLFYEKYFFKWLVVKLKFKCI